MLKLENVTKVYTTRAEKIAALDAVSLHVEPGEMVVVRGPSGCGKTTLLLAAGGLLSPTSGSVEIAGRRPYELTPARRAALRAEAVGFVFQQFYLVPYLTVRENVLAPTLTGTGADGAESRADALLAKIGIADRADHLPSEISTGQRQRTALARALLNDPAVVIADEPTGNLDGENGRAVMEKLRSLADEGRAVMVVTHDAAMDDYATRVVLMADGRIQS